MHVRREQKAFQHLRGAGIAVLCLDIVRNATDVLDDTKRFVHMLVFLRKIADFDRFSDFYAAAVRRQFPGQKLEKRRLPGAVFADDTDAVVPQHVVGKVHDHRHTVKGFGNMRKFDDLFS